MKKTFLMVGVLALGLGACGDSGTPAQRSGDTADTGAPIPVEPDGGIGDGATPLPEPGGTTPVGDDKGMDEMEPTIPSALRGRWGMNANDCDASRSDAKGLLTIGDQTLKFYESVGTLTKTAERDATRLRGTFAFTGEGQTWQRDVVLDAQDGNTVLIRREYGDGAAPGPFRYERCAS
ncbi:hypothetical protein EKN06_09460 [Croceicoccus ponticola]|uniref:Lipocalin-like domain-containing protein n=1 Tax=Croceicoccus ponticola TaxID=2217664 RepID=A0A437GXM0_9SPHN|nr:hypothetical protein [Croceicoccus ponticola]RVQ67134.1 hypothetical protein EKN06_09460 [Croceicoccus ponticola]